MPGAGLITAFLFTIIASYFPGLFNSIGFDMDINQAIEMSEMLFEAFRELAPAAFTDLIIPISIKIVKEFIPWI